MPLTRVLLSAVTRTVYSISATLAIREALGVRLSVAKVHLDEVVAGGTVEIATPDDRAAGLIGALRTFGLRVEDVPTGQAPRE